MRAAFREWRTTRAGRAATFGAAGLVLLAIIAWAVGWYWSREPDTFWVNEAPEGSGAVGYSTVDTLIRTVTWLLDKPGGYLSNDVMPPSVWLDNMPNFEFGVLV